MIPYTFDTGTMVVLYIYVYTVHINAVSPSNLAQI